jgi:hypothetical protein
MSALFYMNQADDFRRFYNHTIHPEMMRLDRQRVRLLWLLFFSILLIISVLVFAAKLQILPLSMALMFPIGIYISYLYRQIRKFQNTFKPHVVRLILDFIDNDTNFGTLHYDEGRSVEIGHFHNSNLFADDIIEYKGEDYIMGIIGELSFELCELEARSFARVRSRIDTTFRGIFLHAQFHNREGRGKVIALPRGNKPFEIRTIKNFVKMGAKEVPANEQTSDFRAVFITYATADAPVYSLLSEEMQEAILDYRDDTSSEIRLSFIGNDFYVAVSEPNDLLEPFLFQSNVSYDLAREFHDKLQLLMSIVRDFDVNN